MRTKTALVSGFGFRVSKTPRKTPRNSKLETRNAVHASGDYLVGGVNSPVRAFRHVGAEPLIVKSARGAEITDTRGRAYTDFISAWGALILGHNPPAVTASLRQALTRGAIFGLTCPAEHELAAAIAGSTPAIERVRFTASGTEACMTAVKLARACTRRSKILVFDGGYHGHADALLGPTSAGVPATVTAEVIRVPYNDPESCSRALQRHAGEFACAIVEPVAANMGLVLPEPGFLEAVRRRTAEAGALLIFDEVVTGFRLGYGGHRSAGTVTPDLTVFGKIIGGGLPIGAVGGPAALMSRLAPEGDVYHGGTFAGHPLAMAAGVATLRALQARPPYERLDALGAQLAEGLEALGRSLGVPLRVNRAGSMLTAFFTEGPVRNLEDAKRTDRTLFARWANGLRRRGILVPPSPLEAMFLMTAHTGRHVDQALTTSRSALADTNGR